MLFFCFFKQKTAYVMRISDWSSDVCSFDLWRAGAPDPIRWSVSSMLGSPDWASEGEVRTAEVPFRVTDAGTQIAAVRQGLGITTLPCFVGDADPLLVRVPGTDQIGRASCRERVCQYV